jgi:hypothetical protein
MFAPSLRKEWAWVALAMAGCLAAGCSSKVIKERPAAEVHILKLSSLWSAYRQAHGNRAPDTIDQLKAWAKTQNQDRLKEMGIEDLEQAFVSPRDNQPYRLAKPNPKAPGAHRGVQRVVAYEQVGVNGKRLTVSSMGSTSEMSEEELKSLVPGL